MNSSMFMSSSRVHFVVPGDCLRFYEFTLWPLRARAPPTYEYCLLMLSSLSFFSLASLASSSLLRITGPEEGAGTFLTLVLEEAREILETLDFESSAPLSLR
jgi:hypothetical protein